MKKIKYTILFSILMITLSSAQTQTSDTNYRNSIIETIKKIETIFKIKVVDDRGLLKGKELDFSLYQLFKKDSI